MVLPRILASLPMVVGPNGIFTSLKEEVENGSQLVRLVWCLFYMLALTKEICSLESFSDTVCFMKKFGLFGVRFYYPIIVYCQLPFGLKW